MQKRRKERRGEGKDECHCKKRREGRHPLPSSTSIVLGKQYLNWKSFVGQQVH